MHWIDTAVFIFLIGFTICVGIVKSKEVAEYEDYVTRSLLEKNETNGSGPANDTNEETNGSETDQGKGE